MKEAFCAEARALVKRCLKHKTGGLEAAPVRERRGHGHLTAVVLRMSGEFSAVDLPVVFASVQSARGTVHRLWKRGWLRQVQPNIGGHRPAIYTVTAAGRKELARWEKAQR